MDRSAEVDELADQLNKLAGYTASASQVLMQRRLRELRQVKARLGGTSSSAQMLEAIMLAIETALSSLSGKYELPAEATVVSAEQVRQAIRILFKLVPAARNAAERQAASIEVLGLSCNVDRFRAQDHDSRRCARFDLMRILARELLTAGAERSLANIVRVKSRDDTYYFDERKTITRVECHYCIESMVEAYDAKLWTVWDYPPEIRSGVVTYQPLYGIEWYETTDEPDSANIRVDFQTRPLTRGKPYHYGYALEVGATLPAARRIWHQSPLHTERWELKLRFQADYVPAAVWRFDRCETERHAPNEPNSYTEQRSTGQGEFEIVFEKVEPGWAYGIRWRW